jgi:hypothetical protein
MTGGLRYAGAELGFSPAPSGDGGRACLSAIFVANAAPTSPKALNKAIA